MRIIGGTSVPVLLRCRQNLRLYYSGGLVPIVAMKLAEIKSTSVTVKHQTTHLENDAQLLMWDPHAQTTQR